MSQCKIYGFLAGLMNYMYVVVYRTNLQPEKEKAEAGTKLQQVWCTKCKVCSHIVIASLFTFCVIHFFVLKYLAPFEFIKKMIFYLSLLEKKAFQK